MARAALVRLSGQGGGKDGTGFGGEEDLHAEFNSFLESHSQELSRKLAAEMADNMDLRSKIHSLEGKLLKRKEAMRKAKEVVGNLRQTRKGQETRIQELEQGIRDLESQHKAAQLQETRQHAEDLKQLRETLQAELHETKLGAEKQRAEDEVALAGLRAELKAQERELRGEAERKRLQLEQQLHETEADKRGLEQTVQQLREVLERERSHSVQLQQRVSVAEQGLQETGERIRSLERQLKQLESEAGILQQDRDSALDRVEILNLELKTAQDKQVGWMGGRAGEEGRPNPKLRTSIFSFP